jgi:hypothetical protein
MARAGVTGRKPQTAAFDNSDDAPNPPPTGAYTIRQFARAHGLSEDMFYKMRRAGWGPKVMRVGSRTLISVESAAAWRREREADAATTAA